MNFSDLEKHPLKLAATLVIFGIASCWATMEAFRVTPLQEQVKDLKAEKAGLTAVISDLKQAQADLQEKVYDRQIQIAQVHGQLSEKSIQFQILENADTAPEISIGSQSETDATGSLIFDGSLAEGKEARTSDGTMTISPFALTNLGINLQGTMSATPKHPFVIRAVPTGIPVGAHVRLFVDDPVRVAYVISVCSIEARQVHLQVRKLSEPIGKPLRQFGE